MPMFRQAGELGLQIPCGHRPLAGAEYLLGTLVGVVPAIYASRTRLLRTAGADRRRLSLSTPEGPFGPMSGWNSEAFNGWPAATNDCSNCPAYVRKVLSHDGFL